MNAVLTLSPTYVALLRAEATRAEVDHLVDLFRLRGRDPTDAEDERLRAAVVAQESAEAALREAASEALGVDVMRVAEALS